VFFILLFSFTMLNNSSLQKWARLAKKSLDNQFMNEIISGMNSSPFEAKAVLDTVHKVYGDFFETAETLTPGKARFIVISAEDSPAKSLKEAKKVSVVLTINDDGEDLGIKQKSGCARLRQHRLQRICNEAFMQGGLLTVEDVANRIFCCGERTVVRDLHELKKQGVFIPLRSTIKDMGRTLSHRSLIVGKWVKGHEYSEIARETNHSVSAVSNYVHKFKQAVALMKDGYDVYTIAFLVKISKRLAEEYIDMYAHAEIIPSRKEELDNLLKKRMSNK
jgi:hypothetical protein